MPAEKGKFERLLQALSEGSEEAAWEIVQTYSPNILRAVRRTMPVSIRPKIDSVDIVQSVWASLLLGKDDMSGLQTPERFIAYLVGTAKQKVWATYRRYTRTQKRNLHLEKPVSEPSDLSELTEPGLLVGTDPTGSAVATVRETWNRVLEQSNDRDRMVAQLRLSGLSRDEIAEQLQISSRTVNRTLERLMRLMTE